MLTYKMAPPKKTKKFFGSLRQQGFFCLIFCYSLKIERNSKIIVFILWPVRKQFYPFQRPKFFFFYCFFQIFFWATVLEEKRKIFANFLKNIYLLSEFLKLKTTKSGQSLHRDAYVCEYSEVCVWVCESVWKGSQVAVNLKAIPHPWCIWVYCVKCVCVCVRVCERGPRL